MNRVNLEPLLNKGYLLRLGPPDWEMGQPYFISLVVIHKSDTQCELSGADKPLVPSYWRAISTALNKMGYKTATFERHRADGTIDHKEVRLLNYERH